MTPDAMPNTLFNKGDSVVLFRGPNVYRSGVFSALRKDSKWADIREHDGILRPHPVEWLKHQKKGDRQIGSQSQATRPKVLEPLPDLECHAAPEISARV